MTAVSCNNLGLFNATVLPNLSLAASSANFFIPKLTALKEPCAASLPIPRDTKFTGSQTSALP